MIEAWLVWQIIKVSSLVFLGAIFLWWIIWKYLDFEAEKEKRGKNAD